MAKDDYAVGTCEKTNKYQYATQQDARRAAKQFRKKTGPRLQQYMCNWCLTWHNGHNRTSKRRQEIQDKYGPKPWERRRGAT